MSNRALAETRLDELRTAYAILMSQGVLDVFGHITFRCMADPQSFWLFAAGAPALMSSSSLIAYDQAGRPVDLPEGEPPRHFSERFIHAAIYARRPDVQAICHHHGASIMPFAIAGVALRPVSQTGASMGLAVPVWDSRAAFGDTRLLVSDAEQAESLASSLGAGWMVLMQNHGATVAGRSLKELVFRAVHYCRDAMFLRESCALGTPRFLSPGEISHYQTLAADPVERSWAHWAALPETRQFLC
jgi:ribulose-5-phosphate 4-epimerase/fuculose-1-phosphate aldolase